MAVTRATEVVDLAAANSPPIPRATTKVRLVLLGTKPSKLSGYTAIQGDFWSLWYGDLALIATPLAGASAGRRRGMAASTSLAVPTPTRFLPRQPGLYSSR